MSKGYEERYLMILLSAVMSQKTASEPLRQLDWEKMFRLADYHHVAHAVYYGIMGLEEDIPQSIRQRFFDKYLEAVYRTDRLQTGEREVCRLLERGKIHCFILSYFDIVKGYPIEEMCCRESIEIGTDRKNIGLIGGILENVDFEERQTEEHGHKYYRVPGISVLCYSHSQFFSRSMQKFYKHLLSTIPYKKGFKYIHEMSPDDKYLFLMCRLIDCYARSEISLNQIMDFWIFYKKYAESFSWPYIYDKLKKLKIAEFAEKLEYLILRWFGTGTASGIESTEVYDAMESYILSKGVEGREISSQFLPLIKTVADCYARNRKAEKFKKLLKWTFPDIRYMETIYPILGQTGFLIFIFWIIRLIRYMVRFIWHEMQENIVHKITASLKKISEKIPVFKKITIAIKNKKLKELTVKREEEFLEEAQIQGKSQKDSIKKKKNSEIDKTTEIPH